MRIIELKAENFKRLLAVEIKPGDGLVQITGRNQQGKSSILDAVFAAFGGGEAIPGKPVRRGAAKAEIYVDVGDIRVTRRFTEKGTTLYVENRDGLRYTSPQAILDELVGKLTFDPLDFCRMKERDQAQTLRDLAGLDTAQLDAKHAELYAKRTEANRRAKDAAALVRAMPHHVGAPAELVSTTELVRKYREARDINKATQAANDDVERAESSRKQQAEQVANIEARLVAAKACLREREDALQAAKAAAADRRVIDLAQIEAEIEQAGETNKLVTANAKRDEAIAAARKLSEEADALTKELDAVAANKAAMLAAAQMPIDGLAVDGGTVTYQGIPLSQASSAEKIRISLAISAALNPKLRVVMIRDGSLLDDESLAEVAAWAEANDMQVLCERVANGAEAVGIVIEDGQVCREPRSTRSELTKSGSLPVPGGDGMGKPAPPGTF